ncbi:hypothetical protein GW17_00007713 [Ensete ventricosum]|nr:hypothetical protein GW17_00007713 [Ensete ventricosum]
MLRPGVTQEWVDEGKLLRERTKNQRWRRPYEVLPEATHGEVILPKSNAPVRKKVDSEEHHSALEADLPIAKEGIQMQGNG